MESNVSEVGNMVRIVVTDHQVSDSLEFIKVVTVPRALISPTSASSMVTQPQSLAPSTPSSKTASVTIQQPVLHPAPLQNTNLNPCIRPQDAERILITPYFWSHAFPKLHSDMQSFLRPQTSTKTLPRLSSRRACEDNQAQHSEQEQGEQPAQQGQVTLYNLFTLGMQIRQDPHKASYQQDPHKTLMGLTSDKKPYLSKEHKPSDDLESACQIEIIHTEGELPAPRNDHRVILKDKKLYLMGGTTDKGSHLDTFVLNLETKTWKEMKAPDKQDENRPVSGMAVTLFPAHTYPHLKGFALIYGGWAGNSYSSDLYLVNLHNMEMRALPKETQAKQNDIKELRMKVAISIGNSKEIEKYQTSQYPPPRKDATFCFIPSENRICLFGGWSGEFNTGAKEELWILSNTWKWEKHLGVNRRGHTSIVIDDQLGSGFLVFGGFKGIKVVCNQSLFFDLKSKKWHTIQFKEEELLPSGRAYHTANLLNNKIVYIGGLDDSYRILEDIWIFCVDKRTWNKVILPMKHRALTRRAGHSSFSIGTKVYILGGMTCQADKKQYVRLPLKEMVCLDFSRVIQEEQPRDKGRLKVDVHNVQHHWDIERFGFTNAKRENLQDLFSDLQGVGITDSEL